MFIQIAALEAFAGQQWMFAVVVMIQAASTALSLPLCTYTQYVFVNVCFCWTEVFRKGNSVSVCA